MAEARTCSSWKPFSFKSPLVVAVALGGFDQMIATTFDSMVGCNYFG